MDKSPGQLGRRNAGRRDVTARRSIGWLLPFVILLATAIGACQGCRTTPDPHPAGAGGPTETGKAALRLYLMSTIAGALEPCGCSKDQLGGLDHLAAFIQSDGDAAQAQLSLAAGPLFFIDPKLEKKSAEQDAFKASALADTMKALKLTAWAPGFNDWAAGKGELDKLATASGSAVLAAGHPSFAGRKIVEAGDLKVGIVGLSDPRGRLGQYPEGVTKPSDLGALLQKEVASLKKAGAQLVVLLATMPRGEALRLAETDGVNIVLVGQPSSEGHGNSDQAPAELIGSTLVIETANHGQTVAVVDIFPRGDDAKPGHSLHLADAGGVAKAEKVADLSRRIRDLETRINSWEKGGKVDAKDVAARKADLEKLRAERSGLEQDTPAPAGSFFRYRVVEVREALGVNDDVAKRMLGYYKQVNVHNKAAFADLVPTKAPEGTASYIGVEECTMCHSEAREVWDKTPHAKAYATLTKDFKEFNLECVGCHVTGYGKPGGSTVTHNDALQNVQCEDCHGPGSLHAASPETPKLITLKPDPQSCVSRCHHPPHVEGFDAKTKMDLVLGPGHGK